MVMLLSTVLVITVFSAALYLTERTYADSWSKSVARSIAVSTALRCENYDSLPSANCDYTADNFLAESDYCFSIAGSSGIEAWRCDWVLASQRTPDYIQEILLLYTTSRVEPTVLSLETRIAINQVYVSLKVCARASFPPIGRWCGTSEAYRYI